MGSKETLPRLDALRQHVRAWRRAVWWQDELDLLEEAKQEHGMLPTPLESRRIDLEIRVDAFLMRTRCNTADRRRVPQTFEVIVDALPSRLARGRTALPTPHLNALRRFASPIERVVAQIEDRRWQLGFLSLSESRRAEIRESEERLNVRLQVLRNRTSLADSTRRRMSAAQTARQRKNNLSSTAREQLKDLRRTIQGKMDKRYRDTIIEDFLKLERIGSAKYQDTWLRVARFVARERKMGPRARVNVDTPTVREMEAELVAAALNAAAPSRPEGT